MKTIHIQDAEIFSNPHGIETKKLYDTEHAMAVHILLKSGESLKRHITPVDVFFYVLEGTGVVEIGDEKIEVTAGTLIESPAKIPHCWYNESETVLRILVVKIPRPKESTRIL